MSRTHGCVVSLLSCLAPASNKTLRLYNCKQMKSSAGICKCPKPKNSLFMKLRDFEPRRKKEVDTNQKRKIEQKIEGR